MTGPIPKRSDQRRRRNKPEIDIATASTTDEAEVVKPPEADADWHPVATMFYESLALSGQSAFYEPSDWAHAFMLAHVMSRCLESGRLSGQLFSAIDSSTTRLMVTEGDRRRLRVELERRKAVDEDEDEAVASVLELRQKLGG